MSADPTSVLDSLGPARRFADPNAPLEARMMAARGALPLPPPQVATVLYALTLDPDPEVKEQATSSLANLPDRVLNTVLGADVHPALLAYFAELFRGDEARLQKLALNAATSDETFCLLASMPFGRVIDIVSQNQVRLLRCPELVEALGENPLTGQSTIDRILHFLGVERGEAEVAEGLPAEEVPEPPPPADAESSEKPVFDAEDASDIPDELLAESDDEEEPSEDRTRSLMSLIQEMNVMEKIKLARFGNGEARGLLIRERNKLVATAAIRSPKIKENEIITYSKSRNLHDEVIRIISSNREWTKNYQVKHALTTNPKTPPSAAIKFLNYLTDRDLKSITRSRDVPGAVASQARRILQKKGKL